MEKLPLVLDLTGTFVFALSGALAGVKRALDLFGVLVLSFAAANSGGITRDLLIGVVPPGAVDDWRYLGVSLFAGLITFYFSSWIVRMSNSVLIFDAAGLALFAVTGASKALAHGLNPVMAIVLGMVTGIGGGMVRDVLLAEIPTVLRAELYAVAALAAATIVVVGHMLQFPVAPVTAVALILCFSLRVMAMRRGWRLPVAKFNDRHNSNVAKAPSNDPKTLSAGCFDDRCPTQCRAEYALVLHRYHDRLPLLADIFAKIENRATLKLSRKLIFGLLCCCVALQRHYGGP